MMDSAWQMQGTAPDIGHQLHRQTTGLQRLGIFLRTEAAPLEILVASFALMQRRAYLRLALAQGGTAKDQETPTT